MSSGPLPVLSPSKRKWLKQETLSFQKTTMTDIATLLSHHTNMDLAEAFCSHDSMMTKIAQQSGMTAERWTINDYDLSTESGFAAAEARLRELRPRRLWLSPECGPFSQMQNTNQRSPEQVSELIEKRE